MNTVLVALYTDVSKYSSMCEELYFVTWQFVTLNPLERMQYWEPESRVGFEPLWMLVFKNSSAANALRARASIIVVELSIQVFISHLFNH